MSRVAGRIFWGFLSDRLFCASRRNTLLAITLIGALVSGLMALIGRHELSHLFLALMVLALGTTTSGWNDVYIALIAEISGTRRAGRGLGISLTIIQVGAFMGPPLFGLIVDLTHSYAPAWGAMSVALIASAAILRRVREEPKTRP